MQGGNNSINLNVYFSDCVDSSVDPNTIFFNFDWVNFFLILILWTNILPHKQILKWQSQYLKQVWIFMYKQSNFLVKRSMDFHVKKQPSFLMNMPTLKLSTNFCESRSIFHVLNKNFHAKKKTIYFVEEVQFFFSWSENEFLCEAENKHTINK